MTGFLRVLDSSCLDDSRDVGITHSLVDVLLMLRESDGRLDFLCFVKKGASIGDSFGDS